MNWSLHNNQKHKKVCCQFPIIYFVAASALADSISPRPNRLCIKWCVLSALSVYVLMPWRFSFVCGRALRRAIFRARRQCVCALNGKCKSRIFTKLLHFHCDSHGIYVQCVAWWRKTIMCVHVRSVSGTERFHTYPALFLHNPRRELNFIAKAAAAPLRWWYGFLFFPPSMLLWCNSWRI